MENNPQQDPGYPSDMADLLERIQRDWAALQQAIAPLSEEQLSAPGQGGWSVKDNLAHITAWEHFMLACYLKGMPAHQAFQIDEVTLEAADEDGINDILFRRNRGRPASAVLEDFQNNHAELIAYLEQMPFERLVQPRFPDQPERGPLINWVIGNTYDHYQEHRKYILALTR